jgi:hypothetical protein
MTTKTKEEKQAIVAKVDELRKAGATMGKACEEAGTNNFSYYTWKKQGATVRPAQRKYVQKTKTGIRVSDIPHPTETQGRIFFATGTPADVADLMRRLQ